MKNQRKKDRIKIDFDKIFIIAGFSIIMLLAFITIIMVSVSIWNDADEYYSNLDSEAHTFSRGIEYGMKLCQRDLEIVVMNCSNIDNNVWRCENGRFYHFT